ncbi:hypothetical protein IFR04_008588 [Cadophora malorum]|uniref:Beta-xylosidase C-terminal Concanavalin A-like domain-containing protein n=1 Tax=Cadophora malorum TaxID=108018 RepID=A0A8H7TER6_9HELO|nr:hypothetical protein IFR04_008588 [Cadophora malorum]
MATSNTGQQDGPYAPTIRFRNGLFYLATSHFRRGTGEWPEVKIVIFTTPDPFDSTAWSDPIIVKDLPGLDPDIFWDDDGQPYISFATFGIMQAALDLTDGTAGPSTNIWNGTGGRNAEGPHIYKKDGFYYLLISEGGTETNHSVTIARSPKVSGPYESYSGNPILTNKFTDEYFQTVGHADLFQDGVGNWWGMALATRSGPAWEIYPMGRETVLFPVKWEQGEWPELQQVRGRMSGPLPPTTRDIPGSGPFVDDPDEVDFSSGIPDNFITWRAPKTSLFHASPRGHPQTLRAIPSRVNLTADDSFSPAEDGLAFIARKQTSTLFDYSVDISLMPTVKGEEAGVSVFLTQQQHIDLGIVNLPSGRKLIPHFRFRVEASGKSNITVPATTVVPVPRAWLYRPTRLYISTLNDSTYVFSASPARSPREKKVLGRANGEIVSGGSGPFTGVLIGVYATTNGGEWRNPVYFSRWVYSLVAQKVGEGDMAYLDADKYNRLPTG